MATENLYSVALAADQAWGDELRRLFGKNAGDVRYTRRGHGEPGSELRRLHDAKLAADEALRAVYLDGWGKEQLYNGMHAVDDICNLDPHLRPHHVIIQSVNGPAAQMMYKQLLGMSVSVEREPFVDPSWYKPETGASGV